MFFSIDFYAVGEGISALMVKENGVGRAELSVYLGQYRSSPY